MRNTCVNIQTFTQVRTVLMYYIKMHPSSSNCNAYLLEFLFNTVQQLSMFNYVAHIPLFARSQNSLISFRVFQPHDLLL